MADEEVGGLVGEEVGVGADEEVGVGVDEEVRVFVDWEVGVEGDDGLVALLVRESGMDQKRLRSLSGDPLCQGHSWMDRVWATGSGSFCPPVAKNVRGLARFSRYHASVSGRASRRDSWVDASVSGRWVDDGRG